VGWREWVLRRKWWGMRARVKRGMNEISFGQ
jgi:hypothetical protein